MALVDIVDIVAGVNDGRRARGLVGQETEFVSDVGVVRSRVGVQRKRIA
jgi:hypothetical protein